MAEFFQPLSDGVVVFYKVFVSACLELCLEDGVVIAVVFSHNVLVDSS